MTQERADAVSDDIMVKMAASIAEQVFEAGHSGRRGSSGGD